MKQKKTNKGIKKLLMSLVALAVAMVGAATSTYAWFTLNAAPRVGEFKVQATVLNSLEIALDNRWDKVSGSGVPALTGVVPKATDYKALAYANFINGYDIEQYIKARTKDAADIASAEPELHPSFTKLGAVSDMIALNNKAENFRGAIYGMDYVEFTLYFRSETNLSGDQALQLDMAKAYQRAGQINQRRTYIEAATDGQDFTLPTVWNGNPADLVSLVNSRYFYVNADWKNESGGKLHTLPGAIDTNIVGINMFKYTANEDYLHSTDGIADTGSTIESFVNPSTGEIFAVDYSAVTSTDGTTGIPAGTTKNVPTIAAGTPDADNKVIYGYASNAMRMSIATKTGADIAKAPQDNPAFSAANIWDPYKAATTVAVDDNELKNDVKADNFAWHMYLAVIGDANLDQFGANDILPTGTFAQKDDGSTGGAAAGDDSYFTSHMNDSDIATVKFYNAQTTPVLFEAGGDGYFYGSVKVLVWIDGWDAEAFNGIFTSIANIGLQFTVSGTAA